MCETQPLSTLNCGSEEADTRIWLHVLHNQYSRVLVCSDTDVYHIGFPLLSSENDVTVQLNRAAKLGEWKCLRLACFTQ
jgi:hypothetical protein